MADPTTQPSPYSTTLPDKLVREVAEMEAWFWFRRLEECEAELREQRRLTWEAWEREAILTGALGQAADLLGQVVNGAREVEQERDRLRDENANMYDAGRLLQDERDGLASEVVYERERGQRMHRRAQKAEGKLARCLHGIPWNEGATASYQRLDKERWQVVDRARTTEMALAKVEHERDEAIKKGAGLSVSWHAHALTTEHELTGLREAVAEYLACDGGEGSAYHAGRCFEVRDRLVANVSAVEVQKARDRLREEFGTRSVAPSDEPSGG